MSSLRARFDSDGFVVLPSAIPPDDVLRYVSWLQELAGGRDRWTLPDGVNRHAAFWPIIFNPRVLDAVRQVCGAEACYLPHNDLHVGFSSFAWHRDSVNRRDGVGPDWDEREEPYRLARVGIYLQRFEASGFRLGLVPGSHRPASAMDAATRRRVRRRTSDLANVVSGLTGLDLVGASARWVSTEPGDAVIFDPRVLHTGSRIHGEKYSVFVAYGLPNSHFHRHWHYYLHLRPDLGYSAIPTQLEERLRSTRLLAPDPHHAPGVAAAWLPSPAYSFLARRFKS